MESSLIGTRLGKYEIRSEIGRGGMGTVYQGYDPALDRWVAVKVLAPHLLWQQEFVERFLREARAAARLKHPNIVTIHDVGQEAGWYYFVMEHLEGVALTEVVLQRGPLSPEAVLSILRPLADALDYAHHRGLVHRDIKPDNVIVGPMDRVTLTDFGIARASQETRLTTAGMVVGTPVYMSPEQAKGLTADGRSDQYSLAVVAYEMLCGRVPFEAESTLALLHMIVYDPPPPIRSTCPDLPPGVEGVLARGLSKEPGNRYPTASGFVEALGWALAGEEVEELPAQPGGAAPPMTTRTKIVAGVDVQPAAPPRGRVPIWVWALGGVVLVALVVGLAMKMMDGSEEPAPVPTLTEVQVVIKDTDTPEPTATREPTSTLAPTATPTPTPELSPVPTSTPKPTATPSLPPVGGRIVFTRKTTPWSNSTSEIWVLDLDTDLALQLTHNNAVDWIPSWSPDGTRIAFTSNREENYDLWVMDADGGNQRPWITLAAWDEYARWSPDGLRLALASTGETSGVWNSEIFIAASNSDMRRVTFNTGADEWPAWSPDGRWLACSSDRDGYMNIYLFSAADGGNITNWTADTASNVQPAWSPDGEWIAFIRRVQSAPGEVSDFGNVWVGKRDQSEFYQLTEDGYANHPAWSPDGRYIVFSHYWDSGDDGEITLEDASDLWAISKQGGAIFLLTEGPEQDLAPQWTR